MQLILIFMGLVSGAAFAEEFTLYSNPITIVRGQVHNAVTNVISLPDQIIDKYKNKSFGVVKFQADIVKIDEKGNEMRQPLYHIYNHHTLQAMGTKALMIAAHNAWNHSDPLGPPPQDSLPHCGHVDMVGALRKGGWKGSIPNYYYGPIGGAEYRDADRDLPKPYRQVVDNPEAFVAVMHLINNQAPTDGYPPFECPCTSDRIINVTNGTIDGVKPLSFHCDKQLLEERNGNCKLEWYTGGYRCCENMAWVVEPQHRDISKTDTVHAKFTFTVDDVDHDTKAAYFMMYDGTGQNAEYDIPKCNLTDPLFHMEGDTCVHTISLTQAVWHSVPQISTPLPWTKIELLTARGHQHKAGMGMELYNARTGELLCKTIPRYGNGTEPGNENGFIVGIEPCVWGPPPMKAPPVLGLNDQVRIVSRYNASEPHYGVMALWMNQAAVSAHLQQSISDESILV